MAGQKRDDGLERARRIAVYSFVGLVVGITVLDRFAPAFLPGYQPLGEAALGLLLGSISALAIGEVIANRSK